MYKTIINDITETKKSLLNMMCECIFKISEDMELLKKEYDNSLIDLLVVLKFNQNDLNFANDEAKAIGLYLKSKGYTKQDAELITNTIMDCFD